MPRIKDVKPKSGCDIGRRIAFSGIFDGMAHANCDASNNWGDPEKIETRALGII